jgi:hypothetical protein
MVHLPYVLEIRISLTHPLELCAPTLKPWSGLFVYELPSEFKMDKIF